MEFVSLSSWAAACSVRPALEVLAGALARRLRIQNLYRFPLQPSDLETVDKVLSVAKEQAQIAAKRTQMNKGGRTSLGSPQMT